MDFCNELLTGTHSAEKGFRDAFRHIANCKGCGWCRVHRDAMRKVKGFEEQRWALFRSLLLDSGVDWHKNSGPPDEGRIRAMRDKLENRKKPDAGAK